MQPVQLEVRKQHRVLVLLLLTVMAVAGWTYRDTVVSIVQKWHDDAAFSHGFLILPISLWLAWRKRAELATVPFRPSWLGVIGAVLCVAAWIVARGSGVRVIEQFAVVAMIPALVLAALGWRATLVLIFPLAFLFFMVPFGRGIVPLLMQVTADVATVALQWTGIPVLRSYMHISIPGGYFEVARACSGLNYFVTSLVLGALYAHINYRSWRKRLLCVAAFVVIPVLLNGLRVYFTILVSHLTDMRYGPGTEHVTFGRIFFVVMMLVFFWIGRRWHDDAPPTTRPAQPATAVPPGSWAAWLPLPVAILAILPGPKLFAASIAQARAHLADTASLVTFPKTIDAWADAGDATGRWRPLYRGGLLERQALYANPAGESVDVFVAVYGLGTSLGAEMISYSNVISPYERGSLAFDARREIELAGDMNLEVRELVIEDGLTERLVWQWFVVGDRPLVSQFAVKALEAVAFVTRGADSERIVTLSTLFDAGARDRLQAFASTHAACVIRGYTREACGG